MLQEPYVELFSDSGRAAWSGEIQLPSSAENKGENAPALLLFITYLEHGAYNMLPSPFTCTASTAQLLQSGVFFFLEGGGFLFPRVDVSCH